MTKLTKLFSPVEIGALHLQNRVVMAPMTRSRANEDDTVSELQEEYYHQRASAGMIITEGVHPNPDGKGYCRTPGIYNQSQVDAWKRVTDAVHKENGIIVCQLMHCGRVGHPFNKAERSRTLAPSAITCKAKIYTEAGMEAMPEPEEMSLADIHQVMDDYRRAALYAREAGFDGVELHCASGYLPAQFLSTGTNKRQDQYGGTLPNRLRFAQELLAILCEAIGSDRVGFRICPGNPFNDLQDDNPEETFRALLESVNPLRLAYVHVIRMPNTGIDAIALANETFSGPLIVNDSYSADEAEGAIVSGVATAVSFGRSYIANPDLVERLRTGAPLNELDLKTLYTAGKKGYTDYPFLDTTSNPA